MKNAIILTEGILNEVVKGIFGEQAVVSFLEEMEMDAIIVYNGSKIKKIIELEDALPSISKVFKQNFLTFEVKELEQLGTAYVFFV